jgi:hypothetical protein
VFESDEDHTGGKKWYWALRGLNAFCWANVGKNIYRFRPFRTVFWMVPTLLSYQAYRAFYEHFDHVIQKRELQDDGKHVKVTLFSNRTTSYLTTDFHPSDQRDVIGNLDRFGMVGLELFPIRIQNKLYVIDKNGNISNDEVFKALCNGF